MGNKEEAEKLLEQLLQLEQENIQTASEFAYILCNEQFWAANFEKVNDLLLAYIPRLSSTELAVLLLVYTCPAAPNLPARAELFEVVKKRLEEEEGKEKAAELLHNLDQQTCVECYN